MIKTKINIATIDLYNNEKNEGMRCIKEIAEEVSSQFDNEIIYTVYDTRYKNEIPDLSSDIFISSGGPGSPFEGEGTSWEKKYYNLLDKIWNHNQNKRERKKFIFFICHSFQMMSRFFQLGEVNERFVQSFGVLPFTKTSEGENDPLLFPLGNPFFAADIRKYQVVNPDKKILDQLNAKILSWEIPEDENKTNPAVAGIRISDEIVGTQFHPEADPESMLFHIKQNERKNHIISRYGEERYNEMTGYLQDEDKIKLTRKTVLPSFLRNAIESLSSVTA